MLLFFLFLITNKDWFDTYKAKAKACDHDQDSITLDNN